MEQDFGSSLLAGLPDLSWRLTIMLVRFMGYLIGSDGSINIVSRILHRAIDCRLHSLLL